MQYFNSKLYNKTRKQINRFFNSKEKVSIINGIGYNNACDALKTLERLFNNAEHKHEFELVLELALKVFSMFKLEKTAAMQKNKSQVDAEGETYISTVVGSPEEFLAGSYESVKRLGKGCFGSVWKGRCIFDHKFYAIKCMNIADTQPVTATVADKLEKLTVEVRVLSTLTHPNIVRYYSAFTETHGNPKWFFIRMQLCSLTLSDWLDVEKEKLRDLMISDTHIKCLALSNERTGLIVDILQGLAFIHKRGLVHRDLHTRNIFLQEEADGLHALIGDFGLSGAEVRVQAEDSEISFNKDGTVAVSTNPKEKVINRTVLRGSRHQRRLESFMQSQTQNEVNFAWDLNRFGEAFFEIRYLQELDQLDSLPQYLLESDNEMIKDLVVDWQPSAEAANRSWSSAHILERNDFQAYNRITLQLHQQVVESSIKRWKNLMVPLVEHADAGRPIDVAPGIEVISATLSNGVLYLLCVNTKICTTYSIQQVDQTQHEFKAIMIYEEEPDVVMAGIILCKGLLACVRERKELLFVERRSPAIIKATIPLFLEGREAKYLDPETTECTTSVMNKTSSFSNEFREAFLINGPESIIFVAHRGSPYIFTFDVSKLISSAPVVYNIGQSDDIISAICYLSSERELFVASSNSEHKTLIEVYSYSNEQVLKHKFTLASYRWAFCDLHPVPCGHLLLSRTYPENKFIGGGLYRKVPDVGNELFAYYKNNSLGNNCMPFGLCACVRLEPRCWIVETDETAPPIGATATASRLKDSETMNTEWDKDDGLCSSSVYYIDVSYRKIETSLNQAINKIHQDENTDADDSLQKIVKEILGTSWKEADRDEDEDEYFPEEGTLPVFSLRKLVVTHFKKDIQIELSTSSERCDIF